MNLNDVQFPALMALCASALASCGVTILIWRRDEPVLFRVAVTVVAFFPVVGPVFGLWVTSFPDRMHPALQAKYPKVVNSYSIPQAGPTHDGESKKGNTDASRKSG